MANLLLIMKALGGVGTGIGLLIALSFVVALMLGDGLTSPQAIVLGRITGAALISIGITCWLSGNGAPPTLRSLYCGVLLYDASVPALLMLAAITDGLHGIAL